MTKQELLRKLADRFPERIVRAFGDVDRERFTDPDYAYVDAPYPIGEGQTISQPSTIAFMLHLLDPQPGEEVLELGSGSGYVCALLSGLVRPGHVYGVELRKDLADRSRELLEAYDNVSVHNQDGSTGLMQHAPYHKILISAEMQDVPRHLLMQLEHDGIIVVPILGSIYRIVKSGGNVRHEEYPGFAFVPFQGGEKGATRL